MYFRIHPKFLTQNLFIETEPVMKHKNSENFVKVKYRLKCMKMYTVHIVNINPTLHTKHV